MDIPLQHVLVALFVVLLGGSTRVKTRHEGSLAPPALVAQLLRSRRARPDVLLLLGPCGAGKTALFSLLAHGTAHTHTTTSMVANAGPLRPPPGGRLRRPLTVVDCPGHGRLRGLLDVHAPRAAAFVLVLDARDGSFLPTAREAAECVARAVFIELVTHASFFALCKASCCMRTKRAGAAPARRACWWCCTRRTGRGACTALSLW